MAMKHFPGAQHEKIESMGLEGIQAFLKDVVSSSHATAPITAGFFRMEAGNPLEYTYSYDECKLMLEGEMTIAPEGGEAVTLKPGDMVFFDAGTKAVFSSATSGTVFYVGQRKEGEL